MVAVRQAPAAYCPAILSGIASKVLAQPPFARVGGRAQLEHLRQDLAQGKPKERSQLGGHAKADKLGSSSTAGQGAGRRLQGARVEKWDSDSDSDKSDMPMTRRGSWCRGEAVEAGRLAVSAGGAQDGKRCGGRQGAAS